MNLKNVAASQIGTATQCVIAAAQRQQYQTVSHTRQARRAIHNSAARVILPRAVGVTASSQSSGVARALTSTNATRFRRRAIRSI